MTKLTIDRLSFNAHQRYAKDAELFDTKILKESADILCHAENLGVESIYSSKLIELLGTDLVNSTWATFGPPPTYKDRSKLFFSNSIISHIAIDSDANDNLPNKQHKKLNKKRKKNIKTLKRIILRKKRINQSRSLFERDKFFLLKFLDLTNKLNVMLTDINSKKHQFQKG